jgi:hypothetical protein
MAEPPATGEQALLTAATTTRCKCALGMSVWRVSYTSRFCSVPCSCFHRRLSRRSDRMNDPNAKGPGRGA